MTQRQPPSGLGLAGCAILSLGLLSPTSVPAQTEPSELVVVREIRSDLLAAPARLIEAPSGALYVADRTAGALYRIDTRDTFERIARRGEGPGELESFSGLALKGDTLAAVDVRRFGFVVFDSAGQYVREFSLPGSAGFSPDAVTSVPAVPLADGSVLTAPVYPPAAVASGTIRSLPYLRVDSGGTVLDTVATMDMEGMIFTLDLGRLPSSIHQPLLTQPEVILDYRGRYVVALAEVEGTLQGTWTDLQRGERWSRTLELDRPELRRPEVEAVLTPIGQSLAERFELTPARARAALDEHVVVPERVPYFTSAIATHDGEVWLKRFTTGDRALWDQTDREGRLIRRVELAESDRVLDGRGPALWLVRLDALDVPRIVQVEVR